MSSWFYECWFGSVSCRIHRLHRGANFHRAGRNDREDCVAAYRGSISLWVERIKTLEVTHKRPSFSEWHSLHWRCSIRLTLSWKKCFHTLDVIKKKRLYCFNIDVRHILDTRCQCRAIRLGMIRYVCLPQTLTVRLVHIVILAPQSWSLTLCVMCMADSLCVPMPVYSVHSDQSIVCSDGKQSSVKSSVKSTGSEGSCSLTTVDFKSFKITWNQEIQQNRETWKAQAAKGIYNYLLISVTPIYVSIMAI